MIDEKCFRDLLPRRSELVGQRRDTMLFLRQRHLPRVAVGLPSHPQLFKEISLGGAQRTPLAREIHVLLDCVIEPLGVSAPCHPGKEKPDAEKDDSGDSDREPVFEKEEREVVHRRSVFGKIEGVVYSAQLESPDLILEISSLVFS